MIRNEIVPWNGKYRAFFLFFNQWTNLFFSFLLFFYGLIMIYGKFIFLLLLIFFYFLLIMISISISFANQ